MVKLSADNKTGMIWCNRLIAKSLRPKDKTFVDSVMRQILANPEGFQPTARQFSWLRDIYARYEAEPNGN